MSGTISKTRKIGQVIEEFLTKVDGGFTLEELTVYIRNENTEKKLKNFKDISPEELDSWLETSFFVFKNENGSFTPRAVFFRDAEFIISPTQEEIEGSFLIPGYRFTPFCFSGINPWEYVLLNGEKKETPKKVIREKMSALTKYYNLLGVENLITLLLEDQEANAEVFASAGKDSLDNESVYLSVFDLAELFGDRKLSNGDGILLRVDDWKRGVFTYEYLSKEERGKHERRKAAWSKKLEEGFAKTFDRFDLSLPIREQLAYAYFYAGTENLKNPPAHLGQFINESETIFLVPLGMESRLWREKEIDISLFKDIDTEDKPDSLNGILADLETMFKGSDIEGFMRDELFMRRGEMDDAGFSHALDRLFPEGEPCFESAEQKRLFLKLCKNLWKKIGKSYNYFSDQETGKLRNEIAKILEDFLNWFYSYGDRFSDINEKDIPVQEMTRLVQNTNMLTEIFCLLNKSKQPDTSYDIKKIKEMLPIVGDSIRKQQKNLEAKTEAVLSTKKKSGNRNLSLVKSEKKKAEDDNDEDEALNIFVFKVSIKDIRPLIWRNIQVPGSYTLGDLHEIIQIAMGWKMDHLHAFNIDKAEYGPKGDDDDNEMFDYDEDDYTLDELELSEKKKFSYTYDFGDEWKHEVLVSKIIPASKMEPVDRTEPLCLSGKRACPREDIGGVYGYERMLNQLKNPEEIDPDMEWIKGYESEYCNIDEINKRLRDARTY